MKGATIMELKKLVNSIINFLKEFSIINKEAIKDYKQQVSLSLVNGDKSRVSNARFALLIIISANCILRLVLPLALVILTIVGIIKFFVPLLAIGALIYLGINHLKEKRDHSLSNMQRFKIQHYESIGNFAFDSFRSLVSWLPIKTPQAVRDTFHNPNYISQGVHEILAFKLLKLSADKVDEEKLVYSQKMLSSLLESKLFEEQNKNPYGNYSYNGVPNLFVVRMEDKGDHLLIQIAFIDNDQIYYDLINQNQITIHRDSPIPPSDEDF